MSRLPPTLILLGLSLRMLRLPPCKKPSERMSPISTCPAALMVTLPAAPPEDMVLSEPVLVSTPPRLLSIVMSPPVPVVFGIGVNVISDALAPNALKPDIDSICAILISPEAIRVTEPAFPRFEADNSLPEAVSIPPALLLRAIFPPLPVPLEDDQMSPVLMSPEAVRVTEPPSPCIEEENNPAPKVVSMAPVLLLRVIAPPVPGPNAYDLISPVLISPEAIRVTEPPFP